MKALFSILTFFCSISLAFAQKQTSYAAWEHPILKQIQSKAPNIIAFSDTNTFVNIAAIDTKAKIIYWFTAIGFLNDAARLTDITYERLITKKETPFEYYDRLTKDAIQLYDAAIFKCRFPKLKAHYQGIPEYDTYVSAALKSPDYKKAKTQLDKLAILYKERQSLIDKLVFSNVRLPNKVEEDITYVSHLSYITKGKIDIGEHTDSTGTALFYSNDIKSPIYKAKVDIANSKLYFYHQDQHIFDSIALKRKNIDTLFNQGTDVFTLYRNYNLWKLITIDSISKLVDSYKAKKYTSAKEKETAETLLANYNSSTSEITTKVRAAHAAVLSKLDTLLATDLHFLEQSVKDDLNKQNPHYAFGEYKNNQLIIYPPAPNNPPNGAVYTFTRGETHYQLTDHRGNVMAVINDKKIGHDTNNDGIIDYYTAEVVKATDYSSFGAPLPGRTYQIQEYKYGYNGKEEDKETGYQDYGMRMYDPNIGRFISPDPIAKNFPWNSPYSFAENDVIRSIDLDGLEKYFVIYYSDKNHLTSIQIFRAEDLKGKLINMNISDAIQKIDYSKSNKLVVHYNTDTKSVESVVTNNDELNKLENGILQRVDPKNSNAVRSPNTNNYEADGPKDPNHRYGGNPGLSATNPTLLSNAFHFNNASGFSTDLSKIKDFNTNKIGLPVEDFIKTGDLNLNSAILVFKTQADLDKYGEKFTGLLKDKFGTDTKVTTVVNKGYIDKTSKKDSKKYNFFVVLQTSEKK